MNLESPADSTFATSRESEVCGQCHSVSRLTNGLCLNCLLRGALDEDETPSGKEAFKEVLAGVKAGDGDWCIAEHEIVNEIARGGMGVVYRAREPHSGRIVALKCVLAYQGDSDHVIARFRREAETAARLDHPNIVPIFRVGETADGFPFYTMKYAAAGSLRQARGPLLQHPRQSAALMVKVARAVHYAHQQGVLHRDLKPGNILLDGHGEPLVSDFGLARCEAVSSYLTRSLASFGTPGYIAPEQADGPAATLTPAADVYSLGAILFELLTGQTPFAGDNAFAVMKQSAEQPAPKLRSLAPKADRDLEIICARCLERESEDRYQTAVELADDLQNWLDDRPIVARPAGLWLRSRRWLRHNRGVAALLAGFCLVIAGSVAWQIRAQRIGSTLNANVLAARSVAILPFYNLDTVSADPGVTKAFAARLREGLATLGPSRVVTLERDFAVSRERIAELTKEGAESRMRAIITGTVRTVQGRRRVAFQLIDPTSKEILFSHLCEENGTRGDVFLSLAKEADQAIYSILSKTDWSDLIRSKSDPGLRHQTARDAITAGRLISHTSAPECDKAIILFRKALEAEPNSSLAHAYLAMAVTTRHHFNPDQSFLELGKTEAKTALQLSPGSAEAHRALAGVHFQEGRFSDALDQALETVEIGGLQDKLALIIGMILEVLGLPDQALGWHQVASQLSEIPGEGQFSIGDCWAKLVDDERAERAYERSVELLPNSAEGVVGLARLRLLEGDFEAAREICRRLPNARGQLADIAAQIEFFDRRWEAAIELYRSLNKANPNGGGSFYGGVSYCSAGGRAKQALGDMDEAKRLLDECLIKERANAEREPGNPEAVYRLAAVEASLGATEASFAHLRQANALGWIDYRSLKLDPRFDRIRGPEFQAIVDELSARVADLRKNAHARR
jgi:tetratricopeptide (TPR) repeat protein/TolB-like protein